jgi:glycosyltransferase involved in cell wall biosynthesis
MKTTILIFIDWFLPGYKAGGPVQSVANFVSAFKEEFDISIVTSDRDLGDDKPYADIVFNSWLQKDGIQIMYLNPSHQNMTVYKSLINTGRYDFIYYNSFFSVPFTLKPLLATRHFNGKIVLAPRGMLGKGALSIKPVKKKVFIFLARISNLFKNVRWLATANIEQEEITAIFGKKTEVIVAPNLPSKRIESNIHRVKELNSVKLFFLSRISEKKNLEFVLGLLKKISSTYTIELNIIGAIEGSDYWQQCQQTIALLPGNIKVNYLGPVKNNEIPNYLVKYHFLILPTLHENYGHAIVEAFQCGCPVIISDCTPWRNLQRIGIHEPGANYQPSTINHQLSSVGWDLTLEKPEEFVKVIEYCAAMGQDEYEQMSQRAFDFAQKIVNDPAVIEANRKLFE